MSDKREKALRKLKKLISQKEGEERIGNFEAAARFAEKIQELLTRHKLEEADVEAVGDPTGYVKVVLYPYNYGEEVKNYQVGHYEDLADVVARGHYCRCLIITGTNVTMLIGSPLDVEAATYVFYRLAVAMREICEREREAAKKRAYRDPGAEWAGNETFRASFYAGFISAINERLQSQKRRLELGAGSCTALIRAERDIEQLQTAITGGAAAPPPPGGSLNVDPFAWLTGYTQGKRTNMSADALPAGEETPPKGD